VIGRFKRFTTILVGCGVLCVGIALTARATGLIFNVTRSAPRGIYHGIPMPNVQVQRRTRSEAYVFFCPTQQWPGFRNNPNCRIGWAGNCPDGYEALLKPVAAWPGDTVTVAPLGVAVNGAFVHNSMALTHDANGKELQHYAFGNYKVRDDQIWVVSSYSPKSFDSRYFGPIPITAVKAWAQPLLVEQGPR
jgi:conjugative transfer signal peptidase TraF